jgi:hypothetical protein
MSHKKKLYFEAGALEVWFCGTDGDMEFYAAAQPDESQAASGVCREFPNHI